MTVARPPSPLELAAVCVGSRWRLILRGELDLATAGLLVDAAGILGEAAVVHADVDLHDVTFVDGAGWRAVEEAHRRILAGGGTCRVSATSPAVERFLALSRVDAPRWAAAS